MKVFSEKDYVAALRIMATVLIAPTNGEVVLEDINMSIEDEDAKIILKKSIAAAILVKIAGN